MHWHILGAGSIGCLWASHLARAGAGVTLLLRNRETLNRFEQRGLSLEADAEIFYPPVEARGLDEFSGDIDRLLVTTKSFDTMRALSPVENRLSANASIWLLQNGIGAQQQIAEGYPEHAVIAGVTTDGAYRPEEFRAVHAGRGKTRFGLVSTAPETGLAGLQAGLEGIELAVEWVDDIWPPIWHKMAINCCINAPTALARCRNGELLQSEESLQQIRGLVTEIQQVMVAAEVGFSFPDLYTEVLDVIGATAENYSSMYQDVVAGRRTEIESINGYVCARGEEVGVATPLNRALVDAVLAA